MVSRHDNYEEMECNDSTSLKILNQEKSASRKAVQWISYRAQQSNNRQT